MNRVTVHPLNLVNDSNRLTQFCPQALSRRSAFKNAHEPLRHDFSHQQFYSSRAWQVVRALLTSSQLLLPLSNLFESPMPRSRQGDYPWAILLFTPGKEDSSTVEWPVYWSQVAFTLRLLVLALNAPFWQLDDIASGRMSFNVL